MKFLCRSFLLVFAACFILGTGAPAGADVPIGDPAVIGVDCGDVKDALIEPVLEVDFYAIELRAGEGLSIDIDSDGSLDSVLGVYDTDGITILAFSDDALAPDDPVQQQAEPVEPDIIPSEPVADDPPTTGDQDPYLDFVAPAKGFYYVAVASYGDENFDGILDEGLNEDDLTTGPYTVIFQCEDPPESLSGGELLGSTVGYTPEDTGLFMINPETGIATLRFPFGSFDAVLEIEFRDDGKLFGATGDGSNNIITIDLDTGIKTVVGTHQPGEINALEFVGDTLYGAHVDPAIGDSKLVIVDQNAGSLSIVGVDPIMAGGVVKGLAYNEAATVMYGATANGALVTINLETGVGTPVGLMNLVEKVTALEFSLDGQTLYGATDRGDLIKIDPATGAVTAVEGTAMVSAAEAEAINLPAVTGLSFVPEKESAKEVTLTSELGNNVMVRRAFNKFKFKKELPDIDIFKFEGMPGEYITVTMDGPPNVEGEASLVVQDVMRHVHVREKRKGSLPLVIPLTLPDVPGKYLIIVRNLMHNPYKGCYQLTVKSGDENGLYTGTAHETLEKTWSVEDSGCTDGDAVVAVEEELSQSPAADGPAGLTSVGESDRAAFSGDSTLEVSIQVSTNQPTVEETEGSDAGDNADPATGESRVQTLSGTNDPVNGGGSETTSGEGDTGATEGGDTEMATTSSETGTDTSGDGAQDVVDGTAQPTDGLSEQAVDDPVEQTPSEETAAPSM